MASLTLAVLRSLGSTTISPATRWNLPSAFMSREVALKVTSLASG